MRPEHPPDRRPLEFDSMKPWFFVRHLPTDQQRPGERYEVQVLDPDGRAVAEARYDQQISLAVGQMTIPSSVLDAGRAQPEGSGDYVDTKGSHTPPF